MHVGVAGGHGHTAIQSQGARSTGVLPGSVIVAPEVKVPFSLSQVDVFLAVARTGSHISASLARSISQPAVSKSLSGLEQVCTFAGSPSTNWTWQSRISANSCMHACRQSPGDCCGVLASVCSTFLNVTPMLEREHRCLVLRCSCCVKCPCLLADRALIPICFADLFV